MTRTLSTMLALGTDAPDFSLPDVVSGRTVSLATFRDAQALLARAYAAVCTPDLFLFDRDRHLVYRGQLDDSRPGNGRPVTGADLRGALDALLAGRSISGDQKPSMGCNIKWKPRG